MHDLHWHRIRHAPLTNHTFLGLYMNIDPNYYKMVNYQSFADELNGNSSNTTILAIIELENDAYLTPPYNHIDIYDLHQIIIWIKSDSRQFAYDLWHVMIRKWLGYEKAALGKRRRKNWLISRQLKGNYKSWDNKVEKQCIPFNVVMSVRDIDHKTNRQGKGLIRVHTPWFPICMEYVGFFLQSWLVQNCVL